MACTRYSRTALSPRPPPQSDPSSPKYPRRPGTKGPDRSSTHQSHSERRGCSGELGHRRPPCSRTAWPLQHGKPTQEQRIAGLSPYERTATAVRDLTPMFPAFKSAGKGIYLMQSFQRKRLNREGDSHHVIKGRLLKPALPTVPHCRTQPSTFEPSQPPSLLRWSSNPNNVFVFISPYIPILFISGPL